METTTATKINDDSDDEGDADGDRDDGDGHNGNDNKATMTRPWRQDHDIKIQQSTKWGAVGVRYYIPHAYQYAFAAVLHTTCIPVRIFGFEANGPPTFSV